MYQLYLRQPVSQVVAGPIILRYLAISRVPIKRSLAANWLRNLGSRTLLLDSLGHVPTVFETTCVQRCIYVRHEISTRGCNLRQEIENSQTNFGDFLEFDGALAESQ